MANNFSTENKTIKDINSTTDLDRRSFPESECLAGVQTRRGQQYLRHRQHYAITILIAT